MSFKFNGTAPEAIRFVDKGVTTVLDKLIYNDVTVWENWILKTGNFLKMTSNSTPSPFTAALENAYGNYNVGSDYWRAFDGTTGNGLELNASKPDGSGNGYVGVRCSFGKTIRAVTLSLAINNSGYSTGIRLIKGQTVLKDITWPSSGTIDLSTEPNGYLEIDSIVIYCRATETGTNNYFNIDYIQITKWYQKGL